MINVNEVKVNSVVDYEVFTGSPHYVHFDDVSKLSGILEFGKVIRYNSTYAKEGINVNIVSAQNDVLHMATYERGVEDETYSCGTGVVAAAICSSIAQSNFNTKKVKTKGGELSVSFNYNGKSFTNILLNGPAKFVFKGKIQI